MTINENLSIFDGKAVQDFDPETGFGDPSSTATRLRLSGDELYGAGSARTFGEVFARFLASPGASDVEALVIGLWGEHDGSADVVVEPLVSMSHLLPRLKALFLGDIVMEENEISWINQSDVSPIWGAFPQLELFQVRGSQGLSLGRVRHARLKSLIIECGGLPARVTREALAGELPDLEHLELWIGTEHYGGTTRLHDLEPLLSGKLFPKLRHLGLRDCDWSDELAAAVAVAPVLGRIETLDLSLGNLGDDGARALAASPMVHRLRRLDIHHHYVSDEVLDALEDTGVPLEARDRQEPYMHGDEEDRYIAVSE